MAHEWVETLVLPLLLLFSAVCSVDYLIKTGDSGWLIIVIFLDSPRTQQAGSQFFICLVLILVSYKQANKLNRAIFIQVSRGKRYVVNGKWSKVRGQR